MLEIVSELLRDLAGLFVILSAVVSVVYFACYAIILPFTQAEHFKGETEI